MSKKKLPVRTIRARYGGIGDRTVDRWVEAGILPKPVIINRLRYWDEDELDAADAARQSEGE
jgi:predicted DNA-binding transcriptional regulator AlpA